MLRFRSLDSVIVRVLGTVLVLGTLSYPHQNQHSTNEFTRKPAASKQVAAFVPDRPTIEAVPDPLGNIPLSFEANVGQARPEVKFLSRGTGADLYLTDDEAVLVFKESLSLRGDETPHDILTKLSEREKAEASAPKPLRMRVVGARSKAKIVGEKRTRGTVNHVVGSVGANRPLVAPRYEQVRHVEILPGIDLVHHGNQNRLEYDFVAAPHADPTRIALRFDGADRVALDDGDLVVRTGNRTLRQARPVAYQDGDRERERVACAFELLENDTVGFRLGAYDPTRTLVIDPLVVDFSTYLGGSGDDQPAEVAVDAAGNIYLAGTTTSTDFPVRNPTQAAKRGGTDIFVTKLDPKTGTLVYSTYFGGNGEDVPFQIAVDAAGNAYVGGTTSSTDFPTLNAVQTTNRGTFDGYILKLNPAGALAGTFSTYIGGNQDDAAIDFDIDARGNVYLTGFTASNNFPTVDPFQATFQGGGDAIVARLNAAGNKLDFSTYLGGARFDVGFGVSVDETGAFVVVGDTDSREFPVTPDAPQSAFAGGELDGFMIRFAPIAGRGTFEPKLSPIFSTYFGGRSRDSLASVSALTDCFAVVGRSNSPNITTTSGAVQSRNMGGNDGLLGVYGPDGRPLYQTLLGGEGEEQFRDVELKTKPDGKKTVSAVAVGTSQNYPLPLQQIGAAASPGNMHAVGFTGVGEFVAPDSDPDILGFQIGGNGDTVPNGVACAPNNTAVVVGATTANNLPFNTIGQQDPSQFQGFIVNLLPEDLPSLGVDVDDATANEGDGVVNIPVTVTPPSQTPVMVNIGAVNGTAQQVTDFVLGQNTVTLPAGTAKTTIPVQIVNDNVPEPTETFTISISTQQSGVTIGKGRSLISILDDDFPTPSICFDTSARFVPEDGGFVEITLIRTGSLSLPSSVRFTAFAFEGPNQALPDVQFTPTSGTVTFPPGSRSQTIKIPILDNKQSNNRSVVEFQVAFADPINAVLCNDFVRVGIMDDERFAEFEAVAQNHNVQIQDGFESGDTSAWAAKVDTAAFAPPPRAEDRFASILEPFSTRRLGLSSTASAQSPRIIGFRVYRVPQPKEGAPLPTFEEIAADKKNFVGTSLTDRFSALVPITDGLTGNWVFTVTALFEDGTESRPTKAVATSLPVIQNATFEKASISFDAAGNYVSQAGATLIVDGKETFPLVLSGTRFVVSKKAKSTPGGQTLKKLVKVDQAAVIVIRNADGKLSLPRKLKRAS